MRRAAAVLLLLAAAPAARAGQGMYFTLEGGYSAFTMKSALKQNLTPQVGAQNAAMLTDNQMPSGSLFGMHLGYNIGGHVRVGDHFPVRIWRPRDTHPAPVRLAGCGPRTMHPALAVSVGRRLRAPPAAMSRSPRARGSSEGLTPGVRTAVPGGWAARAVKRPPPPAGRTPAAAWAARSSGVAAGRACPACSSD